MFDQLYQFTALGLSLLASILYLPFAVLAWAFSILPWIRYMVFIAVIWVGFYFVALYTPTVVDNVIDIRNNVLTPYYDSEWRPILEGIIRQFYNRFICWFDALLWFPYGYGREVLFPIMRDAGFGTVVTNFAALMKQISLDVFLGYVFNGRFFTEELDMSAICIRWMTFWSSWQTLWCFGCEDLCPFFTKLPIIPMFLTSDQYGDQAFWDAVSDFVNGWIVFFQQVIYLVQSVLFPGSITSRSSSFSRFMHTVTPRFLQARMPIRVSFRHAFDLWIRSGSNFWKSMENILNQFWVEFIPFQFDFTDLLQVFNIMSSMLLLSINMTIEIALNSDKVFDHFTATNSDFWINRVKEDYKEVIGLMAEASYFAPIPLTALNGDVPSTITNYELRPTQPSLPNGLPNPLYNVILGSTWSCVFLERVFCDPANQGISCAQKFGGTLLEDVDICCPVNTLLGVATDSMAFLFEFSLHLSTANDFMRYIDKQPFTTEFKNRIIMFLGCAFQFFRVVPNYGYCIEKVLLELSNFVTCTAELMFRVLVAVVTLPYYEQFMPGETNFISAGDNAPVIMAIEFLDRIGDPNNVNGLINCLCTLMNTGFLVPYAGCNRTTCIPTGFVEPQPMEKRVDYRYRRSITRYVPFRDSAYNLTTRTSYYSQDLTPIMTYGNAPPNSFRFSRNWEDYEDAAPALLGALNAVSKNTHDVYTLWRNQKCKKPVPGEFGVCQHPDLAFERLVSVDNLEWNPFRFENMPIPHAKRLTTSPAMEQINCPTNATVAPCFDICCLPRSLIEISTHAIEVLVRLLYEFIQTRTAEGSDYFDGRSCMLDPPQPCLESDLVELSILSTKPLNCLCQFIKLLLPNVGGFSDPCCFWTLLGEWGACVIQILINVGNSINGDAPNYTYITDRAYLVNDFNIVLRISLAVFDCACDFILAIFAVALRNAENLASQFNPCCILRVFVKAGLDAAKMLFRLIISMSTLDKIDSQCYMYVRTPDNVNRTSCPIAIAQLGVMQDFAQITESLFSIPDERMTRECGVIKKKFENYTDFGAATCYCTAVNAVMTMVFKFFVPTGENPMAVTEHNNTINENTPSVCVVDLCCPVYRISQILKAIVDFSAQFLWSFFQNWKDRSIALGPVVEYFYLPQETFEFFFCDEYGPESYYIDGEINVFSLENGGLPIPTPVTNIYALDNAGNLIKTGMVDWNEEVSPISNVPGLSQSVVPNFDGGVYASGIPSLTQNAPLTAPNTYGNVTGILNTAIDLENPYSNVYPGLTQDQLKRIKCGQMEPIIIGIYDLLARCICPQCHVPALGGTIDAKGIGNIVDKMLRFFLAFISDPINGIFPIQLNWPSCLCCGGPYYDQVGMVIPFASAFTVAIRQIMILGRNIANPGYWTPAGGTLVGGSAASKLADNLEDIKKTWISRFLAPFADATCRFLTNSACLLSLLLGETCSTQDDYAVRYMVISSVFRYTAEAAIRFFAVIEGMIKLFTQELPGQCVGNPTFSNGNADDPELQSTTGNGQLVSTCSQQPTPLSKAAFPAGGGEILDPRSMGRIVVSILTFVFDAFIGIGYLSCSRICPREQFADANFNLIDPSRCACYNLSPYVGVTSSVCSFEFCADAFNGNEDGTSNNFTCPGGALKCNAQQALNGTTGICVLTDPPVLFVDFTKSDRRCREGCNNEDPNVVEKGIVYQSSGTLGWVEAGFPEYKPALLSGSPVCKAILTTSQTQQAEIYFGSNTRFYPNSPMDGIVDPRCLCYSSEGLSYPVSTDPLLPNYYLLAPNLPLGIPGCGVPWWLRRNGLVPPSGYVAEADAEQSVCPTYFTDPVTPVSQAFMPVDPRDLPVSGSGPQVQPGYPNTVTRCNTCLNVMYDNLALGNLNPVCNYYNTPPTIPWINGPTGPTWCPAGSYYAVQSCQPVCNAAYRDSFPITPGVPLTADIQCRACVSNRLSLDDGIAGSADVQPFCDRDMCVAKGWCKNDQLVPCARGRNQPILDGVIIIALKYVRCLLLNLFNNLGVPAAGKVFAGILTLVLNLISVIWQLSGGIIRFGVALLVLQLQFLQGLNSGGTIFKVASFGKSILDVFNAFAAIFTQPVVWYAGKGKRDFSCEWLADPYERAECTCEEQGHDFCHVISKGRAKPKLLHNRRSDFTAGMLNMQQSLRNSLHYPDAHECIDTDHPAACICRTIDLHPFCNHTSNFDKINLKDLYYEVANRFNDDTICEMIWRNLDRENVPHWTDVSYSRRVEAAECLTKRARGESWVKDVEPFPKSYFYDAKGNIRLLDNFLSGALNHASRYARDFDDHFRRVRDDLDERFNFKKRFGMSHSRYLQHLNTRALKMRRYLKTDLRMTEYSTFLDPLIWMDSFLYRYRSGYWSHLMDRAWYIYQSGNTTTMLSGSMTDTVAEAMDGYEETRQGMVMASKKVDEIFENIDEIYTHIRNPFKPVKVPQSDLEYPEWPFPALNKTHLRSLFPSIEWPTFNYGPKLTFEIPKLLPPIQWNPRIERNWDAVHRMFYRAKHLLWPEEITQHQHERFIIAGNCRVMDGFITLGTEVMDYCISEFVENTPDSRVLKAYLDRTAPYRPNRPKNTTHVWKTVEGSNWKRAKRILPETQPTKAFVDRRIWKRMLMDSATEFNFYTFVIDIIDSVLGIDIQQLRNSFASDFMAWVSNDSINPKDWPNVGARYYLTFELRCEWPENFNCSIGIGLREALKKVTLYFAIAIAGIMFLFPGLLGIFSFVLSIPAYLVIVTAVAWHYSFACTWMFPSTAIWPFAITVPIFPFPVNILPALPNCLWDELVSILGDIFSTKTFIPASLFSGDGIGFVNCADVGITDGIQNVLFLGYYYLGNTFADIVIGIATVGFSKLIPGLDVYILDSFRTFETASPTQQERQLFCAWYTLPAILGPALLIWLVATLALVLVPALLAVFTAILQFIPALPFYDAVVSPQEGQGWNSIDGEQAYPEEEEEEEDEFVEPVRGKIGWMDWIARKVERRILPHQKME